MVGVIGAVATVLGYLARFLAWSVQIAVYAVGPVLISIGLHMIYPPAALIAMGLIFTWLVTRPQRGAK